MSLTSAEIEKTALLARLRLAPDEVERITDQLGQILDYIAQLDELETDDVEPMAHALDTKNVFAEDEPRPSLPRDAVLANAPKSDDECYRVPPVMSD